VGGAQSLESTVFLDSALHNFEFWYDGINLYFSVDGEPPIVAAPTNLPLDALVLGVFHIRAALDNTSADQSIDKFLALTGLSGLPP
jgi:hypothetical protein